MKIKSHTLKEEFPMPSFYRRVLEENNFCILDIETTGLSSKYHNIILIGLLYPSNNQTMVKQFFAEDPREEEELLRSFAEEMKKFDFFITYNGVAFDLPFMKERFKKYNIPWTHEEINHFDILYFLKKCKTQLPLDNLKLKTVEGFLGIKRRDTISGKDSVELYKNYVSCQSPALEKTILLHNYEDIYYLARVATIFDHFPIVNGLLDKTFLNFIVANYSVNMCYHPYDLVIKKNCLQVSGKTTKLNFLPPEVHYTSSFHVTWNPSEGSFTVNIPLQKKVLSNKEKVYYLQLNEFQPNFDSTMTEPEAIGLFHQHLLEIDLKTSDGLTAVICLINHLLAHIFEDNKQGLVSNI